MGANDTFRPNDARSPGILENPRPPVDPSSKIVLVSGGFDPIHKGHVRLIRHASEYGRVWVALNSDAWLMRKKGYIFQDWHERAEIMRAIACVSQVLMPDDENDTIAKAILNVQPDYFANGGDRTSPNKIEADVCKKLGVKMLFGIGGGKVQSSSVIVRRCAE